MVLRNIVGVVCNHIIGHNIMWKYFLQNIINSFLQGWTIHKQFRIVELKVSAHLYFRVWIDFDVRIATASQLFRRIWKYRCGLFSGSRYRRFLNNRRLFLLRCRLLLKHHFFIFFLINEIGILRTAGFAYARSRNADVYFLAAFTTREAEFCFCGLEIYLGIATWTLKERSVHLYHLQFVMTGIFFNTGNQVGFLF